MESRELNVIVGKAGGNSGKDSKNYKLTIPNTWANDLHITKEDRKVLASFDGKQIIVTRVKP